MGYYGGISKDKMFQNFDKFLESVFSFAKNPPKKPIKMELEIIFLNLLLIVTIDNEF